MIEKIKEGIVVNVGAYYFLERWFSYTHYKIFLLLTLMSGLCPVSVAQAFLQATTVQTIQGTTPYLTFDEGKVLTDLNELLGFTMPKQDGSGGIEKIDVSHSNTEVIVSPDMRYKDITALVVADGQLHDIKTLAVADDDGDAELLENTRVTGQMKVTWYNGGQVVPQAEQDKKLDACGGPYTLKFEIPTAVTANTIYGIPNSFDYGTNAGVTYKFRSKQQTGICYLKPASMLVYKGKTPGVDIKYAEGYNPKVWDDGKGFRANSGFPTVGFNKASFDVIGPGNDQSKFRCNLKSGNWVTLSGNANKALGQNCKVTYNINNKPNTEIVINMDYTADGGNTWTSQGSQTIKIPTKWLTNNGEKRYNRNVDFTGFYDAGISCGAPSYTMGSSGSAFGLAAKHFYSRTELINLIKGQGQGNGYAYLSRDVDGTFGSEWGDVPIFGTTNKVWTREKANNRAQYVVDMSSGEVSAVPPTSMMGVICK